MVVVFTMSRSLPIIADTRTDHLTFPPRDPLCGLSNDQMHLSQKLGCSELIDGDSSHLGCLHDLSELGPSEPDSSKFH